MEENAELNSDSTLNQDCGLLWSDVDLPTSLLLDNTLLLYHKAIACNKHEN